VDYGVVFQEKSTIGLPDNLNLHFKTGLAIYIVGAKRFSVQGSGLKNTRLLISEKYC